MNESKIVDFSERVEVPKDLEGPEEGVFWDVEDFPFPVNSTPDEIYTKIESCLKEMEMDSVGTTRTTIWAYVDEKKNETWEKGGDDKPSRRNRMFIDILLWQLDHLPPASLVVVSGGVRGDKEFFGRLPSLSMYSYAVDVIARPTHPVVPESAEWPRSLLAKSYSFDQSS
ncbi:hypothetical protein DY000_02002518 [Brassica cretica]|uniref:NYN domain-containing protein n=1 Tax=Brassica cretica TaxID=69181 RepID=A0ABQ7CEF5_BRACR|nr:hypothetical protein DY000_02002518 [Brassica cretica]